MRLMNISSDLFGSTTVIGAAVACFFIGLMFCFASRICLRDVTLNLGRYFLANSEVSTCHVSNFLELIDVIHVVGTGINAALCRYLANLGKVACKCAMFAIYLFVLL